MQLSGNTDIKSIREQLQAIKFTFNKTTVSLEKIFKEISILLGDGSSKHDMLNKLRLYFKYFYTEWEFGDDTKELNDKIPEILGRLVVIGVVGKTPSTSEYVSEEYNLTPIGIKIANQLMLE